MGGCCCSNAYKAAENTSNNPNSRPKERFLEKGQEQETKQEQPQRRPERNLNLPSRKRGRVGGSSSGSKPSILLTPLFRVGWATPSPSRDVKKKNRKQDKEEGTREVEEEVRRALGYRGTRIVSLENTLADKVGAEHLKRFMVGSFASETYSFSTLVSSLQDESVEEGSRESVSLAREICERCIRQHSREAVNLTEDVRLRTLERVEQGQCKRAFDEAQWVVFTMVLMDLWPKFLTSAHFKALTREQGYAGYELQVESFQEQVDKLVFRKSSITLTDTHRWWVKTRMSLSQSADINLDVGISPVRLEPLRVETE